MFFRDEYAFLSNFYPCTVNYLGLTFKSSEAAFQAAKCVCPEDYKLFVNLSASEAKKLGRNIKIRPDWNNIRLKVMAKVLSRKFQNSHLKYALLNTKDILIEEENYWKDTYWGVWNGIGENHLGKLLMELRNELQKENKRN